MRKLLLTVMASLAIGHIPVVNAEMTLDETLAGADAEFTGSPVPVFSGESTFTEVTASAVPLPDGSLLSNIGDVQLTGIEPVGTPVPDSTERNRIALEIIKITVRIAEKQDELGELVTQLEAANLVVAADNDKLSQLQRELERAMNDFLKIIRDDEIRFLEDEIERVKAQRALHGNTVLVIESDIKSVMGTLEYYGELLLYYQNQLAGM